MPSWTNWGGNQTAHPVEIAHPRGVEEISSLVKRAAEAGHTVKPIGAGHSFTAIGATDGIQVQLDQHDGLLAVDAAAGLVTVEGGLPLHRLNHLLAMHGLAMANLGDIDVQTITGATSTGTHGTGAKLTGLAAQVVGLELVTGDGSIVTCSATDRPDLFAAARVGLGALGIVSSLTLQTVPAFTLRAAEGPARLPDILDAFDAEADGNDHFEFYWFPHTQRVLTKRNNRVAEGESLQPLGKVKGWIDDELLSNRVFEYSNRLTRRVPGIIPRLNKVSARALSQRVYTAASYEVFCSPRRVRFVEMEYAVPRESIAEVIREVDAFVQKSGLRVSFPVEVRVAAPDDVLLSTAYDRPSAYLAVHMYRGTDFAAYFDGVEKICTAVGGRPHWGKMHTRDADCLRGAYPKFDDFLALRDELDPQRVFGNPYLERVLGS